MHRKSPTTPPPAPPASLDSVHRFSANLTILHVHVLSIVKGGGGVKPAKNLAAIKSVQTIMGDDMQ